jgi:phospholipid/cholesterol/gamma-HCH transport system substrate-binding protein
VRWRAGNGSVKEVAMYKRSTEIAVGIFVIVGAVCIVYLAVSLGGVNVFGSPYYNVTAEFDSVSGLKKGASIEIAGVEMGKVLDVNLDDNRARVTLGILQGIQLTEDTIASIRTQGVIGDKFVKLTPGGSDEVLKPGDLLIETESAISLEELISKYIFDSK